MSDLYSIGSKGEKLLTDYLTSQGRSVKKSDRKVFDLIVDGRYAEVKSSKKPYSALGFIGLTENQYKELISGTQFTLFLVCNTDSPEAIEIVEVPAEALRRAEPKAETTYYWYKRQLPAGTSS